MYVDEVGAIASRIMPSGYASESSATAPSQWPIHSDRDRELTIHHDQSPTGLQLRDNILIFSLASTTSDHDQ